MARINDWKLKIGDWRMQMGAPPSGNFQSSISNFQSSIHPAFPAIAIVLLCIAQASAHENSIIAHANHAETHGAAPAHNHQPAEAADSGDRAGQLLAEVAALRDQLHEYEQRVRLRDILGGIGYIVGIAGLAFYFLGVRCKRHV